MKTLQDMAAMKEEWNRKGFIGASVISAYAKMRLQDLDIVKHTFQHPAIFVIIIVPFINHSHCEKRC